MGRFIFMGLKLMKDIFIWPLRLVLFVTIGLLIAACAQSPSKPDQLGQASVPELPECVPPTANEPLVGNWLNKRQEKGVTGELRTLFTLKADGSMLFTEQLKRPRQPSQGINETGCWQRQGQTLVLYTHTSNGVRVDLDDPIYTNRYQVLSVTDNDLNVRSEQGKELRAERTTPGYRLPF